MAYSSILRKETTVGYRLIKEARYDRRDNGKHG